jgi:hypothetical protein
MKKLILLLAFTLPLCAEPKLADLSWMAGHWTGTHDGWQMEEVWLAPNGGVMVGMHRDAKDAKSSFEFLRIAATPDGLVYLAQPGGKPATPFPLTELSKGRVVFSNPQHDFPKRIIYSLQGAKLCARVEGDGEAAEEWCWSAKK